MKYSKTFHTFCKEAEVSEQEGLELINEAHDIVDFCSIVSRRHGYELTLKEAEEVYETAPTAGLTD